MNKDKITEILATITSDLAKRKYKLLYVTLMGSSLYGTSTGSSDIDVKFIFMPSTEDCVLGVASSNININSSDDNTRNTKDDIDIQGWSVQFFLNLLNKGDTNALDVLFSYTNENCVLYMDSSYCTHILFHSDMLYDKNNLRGLLGYIVTQSERYGIKGSRFSKLKDVYEYIVTKPKNGELLRDYAQDILDEFGDELYCKYEMTSDNREALRLLGKVHLYDIPIVEFVRRIESDKNRYSGRTHAALDGSDWKALSHAYRSIIQAEELITRNRIIFPLENADLIRKIKLGEMSRKDVDMLISDGLDKIQELVKQTKSDNVNHFKYATKVILELYQLV